MARGIGDRPECVEARRDQDEPDDLRHDYDCCVGCGANPLTDALIGQGMTLPSLIRAVRLPEDDGGAGREDAKARIKAAEAAMARLEELVDEGAVLPDSAERLRGAYGFRMNRFRARLDGDDDGEIEERSVRYQRARRELLDAERGAVVQLRNAGLINDEVMNRVQRDIDLEASRLDVSPG